jgi:hypothetical protein
VGSKNPLYGLPNSGLRKFPASSKLNNYPPFLEYLFDLGRQTCDAWVAQNEKALGQHSTIDVQQLLPMSVWESLNDLPSTVSLEIG